MGQKANPISLRLNINRDFESSWYQDLNYSNILKHELSIRNYMLNLFSFMSVYQGRILFQFFPKKLIIHSFITNKNLVSHVASSRKGGSSMKSRRPMGQNQKPSRVGMSSDLEINKNTRQEAILLFMNYVLLLEAQNGKHWTSDRGGSSVGEITSLRLGPSLGSPQYLLFLYLISESKKLHSTKKNAPSSFNFNERKLRDGRSSSVLTQSSGSRVLSGDIDISKYNYSSNSFSQNVLPSLENLTRLNTDFFTLKLKSKYQSAAFLAQYIAECFEKNISFRQVYKQIQREILQYPDKTILGVKIQCCGRINGAEIAKVESRKMGQTSLHTFSAQVDFSKAEAYTVYGIIGIKVWISCVPQSRVLGSDRKSVGFSTERRPLSGKIEASRA